MKMMSHSARSDISAFVLAGGNSQRFGADKALQRWGDQPLLAHVVGLLKVQFRRVYVVSKRATDYADIVTVPVLADVHPNGGPLGGIHAGLAHSPTDWNLFVACDMPWLQPLLIEHLAAKTSAQLDAVVPEVGGWLIPTLALYHRRILAQAEAALAARRLALQAFLQTLHTHVVPQAELEALDPSLQSFSNLNTPQAWRQALAQCQTSPL